MERSQATAPGDEPDSGLSPADFFARLQPYERVLLDLRDHLYEGSWERMLGDLKARLENKPYLYKLSQAITRDIAAIERMRTYELRWRINLSELAGKS